ncbi:MAG: hypothetical protein J1F64_08255 [Oscillospiraceae bacterium]|nr:hypothetical protein [Oscillospiraceae bacterium]
MTKKYVSYIAAGLVFIAAGFLTGYFIGVMLYTDRSDAAVNKEENIIHNDYTAVTSPQIKAAPSVNYDTHYMLKLNDGKLCIYEISGETSRLVREFKTNMDIYPEPDRRELSEGIMRSSLNDALETAENFTS